ncbi:hypothetical protein MBLNU459_g2189t2 [Dothideomycetes sp. NU459]
MAQGRKYAALPDLDEAPDIYETPELTDDTSTLHTFTTVRSASPTASEVSDDGISRHRLQPEQARTQFRSSRVNAQEADFSDRVSSKRKAYQVSSHRRKGAIIGDGEEEDEDWDSQDEEESLQRRLARLMREVQEVQSEVERRRTDRIQEGKGASTTDGEEDEDDVSAKVNELGNALKTLHDSQRNAGSAHSQLAKQLAKPNRQPPKTADAPRTNGANDTLVDTNALDTQTLAKVADFDSRLALLERALGASSIDMPEAIPGSGSANYTPILPTLALLDKQLGLLTSSPSQPHLDALIQKLQEAQAASAESQSTHQGPANGDSSRVPHLTAEDMAKLRSLYSLLPTLTSLTPTLPPLLTRLRSLRTLHASAATATQSLEEVERKQDEADAEIKEWREGLHKVEDAVKSAEKGMRENAGAVEAWVKDLEERVKSLNSR